MTVESDVFDALKALVGNRCYPDVAPNGTATRYITYQKVGGQAVNFLEAAVVGLRNARIQVSCWDNTRAGAAALARQAEDAMVTSTALRARVLSPVLDAYEEDVPLYGTHQDFSVWY